MRVKKTIKKIASIGAAATMVGATLMGAAMAADLSDYPNMFIQDGAFNGVLVVGADAKAEDVIGITNIATSLQTASVQTTTVSDTAAADTAADTSYAVSEGYELCNRNLYPGYNISSCEPSVDDSDLDLLADDVYHDSEGDNDNDEKYTQEIFFQNQGTGQFLYTQDDDDAPTADTYLFIDNSNNFLYNYTLQFDSYVSVDNNTNALAGDDLEGTALNIQGKSYTITDVKVTPTTLTGAPYNIINKLKMQSGDSVVWMSEGESLTRTIDGVEHTVELMDVSADATSSAGSCGFKV
ncbi:S-layer protein, partial [Candidatus Woesearchaeota archaeon]|nr:S-layer protein [Candidatus Woesearchaeota archaeon]